MEFITLNFAPKVRYETLHGRRYLVAPTKLIVEGVLNGSKGPLFYPQSEIAKNYRAWNGVPLTLDHPVQGGQEVSAQNNKKEHLGFVRGARVVGNKLEAESWFDIENTRKVSPYIINRLKLGKSIEVSTGLFTENEDKPGSFKGQCYKAIARNYRPDHLAVLLNKTGACSIKDGCGILVNRYKYNLAGQLTVHGGEGSGNYGHEGRLKQVGGSKPGHKVAIMLSRLKANGGFTYIQGQKKYRDVGQEGYGVSRYPERSKIFKRKVTIADVRSYMASNKDLLEKPNHAVGAWFDRDSKETYLDVAVVIKGKYHAVKLGRKYNQIKIFEFKTGSEISTGGTGKATQSYNIGLRSNGRRDTSGIGLTSKGIGRLTKNKYSIENWREDQHPRDDIGKFSDKTGGEVHGKTPLDVVQSVGGAVIKTGAKIFGGLIKAAYHRYGDKASLLTGLTLGAGPYAAAAILTGSTGGLAPLGMIPAAIFFMEGRKLVRKIAEFTGDVAPDYKETENSDDKFDLNGLANLISSGLLKLAKTAGAKNVKVDRDKLKEYLSKLADKPISELQKKLKGIKVHNTMNQHKLSIANLKGIEKELTGIQQLAQKQTKAKTEAHFKQHIDKLNKRQAAWEAEGKRVKARGGVLDLTKSLPPMANKRKLRRKLIKNSIMELMHNITENDWSEEARESNKLIKNSVIGLIHNIYKVEIESLTKNEAIFITNALIDNPASWVKDEDIWQKAKKAARKQGYTGDSLWAVTTHIYKKMGGKVGVEVDNKQSYREESRALKSAQQMDMMGDMKGGIGLTRRKEKGLVETIPVSRRDLEKSSKSREAGLSTKQRAIKDVEGYKKYDKKGLGGWYPGPHG